MTEQPEVTDKIDSTAYNKKRNTRVLVSGLLLAALISLVAVPLGWFSVMASDSCPSNGIDDGRPICDPTVQNIVGNLPLATAVIAVLTGGLIGRLVITKRRSTVFPAILPAVLVIVSVIVSWSIAGKGKDPEFVARQHNEQRQQYIAEVNTMVALPTFEDYETRYVEMNHELQNAFSTATSPWKWPFIDEGLRKESCYSASSLGTEAYRIHENTISTSKIAHDKADPLIQMTLHILQAHGYQVTKDNGKDEGTRVWEASGKDAGAKLRLTFSPTYTPGEDNVYVESTSQCLLTSWGKAHWNPNAVPTTSTK